VPAVGGRYVAMVTDHHGSGALQVAALLGRAEVARAVMEVGGRELAMLTTNSGDSAVLVAARQGHVEVVRALEDICRS